MGGLLNLLPDALKVIGKVLGIGGKVQEVADAIAGAPPEVRAQLTKDLQVHEQEMKRLAIAEMQTANEEGLAMVASSDPYVARARPTGLYLFYAASVALVIAHIAGVEIDPTFVWSVLAPLGGTGGLYIYNRTREKLAQR